MACRGCEVVPAVPEAGVLALAPELAHTRKKILDTLKNLGVGYRMAGRDVIQFELDEGFERVMEHFSRLLSHPELQACRAVLLEHSGGFGIGDLGRSGPLSTLVARSRSTWLTALLAEERLQVHFQPIVYASDPGRAFAYECLARGLDEQGGLIPPAQLFSSARNADLLFHLDRAARVAAITQAAGHGLTTPLFINFNPTSIYDPAFCLATTIRAARNTGMPSSNFVFEVVESDQIDDPTHLERILMEYRKAGFRVALDDLGSGYGSLNLLAKLRPDYVKLDMELIRGVDEDDYKARLVRGLVQAIRELGSGVIGEGVETEGEYAWLRAAGVDFVQGYHFARPASPPPMLTATV
ncbi:MAG: EAL domain-containing protein [Ectothiorhodospiraceae bacterium]|nr:EAL domain-containing protein [Ectothiorhodospiraceae bacterium]